MDVFDGFGGEEAEGFLACVVGGVNLFFICNPRLSDGKEKVQYVILLGGGITKDAELTAVIMALNALNQPCEVKLTTDSKYVCDAINKGWVYSWRKNGWKKSDKKPKLLNAEEYIQYMKEGKTFTEDYLLKNWDGTTNTSWVDSWKDIPTMAFTVWSPSFFI